MVTFFNNKMYNNNILINSNMLFCAHINKVVNNYIKL